MYGSHWKEGLPRSIPALTGDFLRSPISSRGKSNRLVAYKHGEFVDYDIQEALNMKKDIPEEQYEIAKLLAR